MIPFHGCLVFKQYLPNTAHKYGIKVFSAATKGTHGISKFMKAKRERKVGLCQPTFIDLAKSLLAKKKTHLLGTVSKKRKYLPKEVVHAELKRCQVIVKENNYELHYVWHNISQEPRR
ncbi:hypothetical protein PR048_012301 [Dryococelus australis]|uniref:Uncharacterized protein n=1 Tax=Dryococelus australis TaxID=614101 RepID=A0ABQ9HP39_9NEOP|nr:hypothetical protein PR048_012301 [Dryococelus australis]